MKNDLAVKSVLLCLFIVALFSVVSIRLIYIQGVKKTELQAKALKEKKTLKDPVAARRGTIYDRNGEVLARNIPVQRVIADKNHLLDPQQACQHIATLQDIPPKQIRENYTKEQIKERYLTYLINTLHQPLGLTKKEFEKKLTEKKRVEIVLHRKLDEERAQNLKAHLEANKIKGIYFKPAVKRIYPSAHLAAHVIGYVNHKGAGSAGVESAMDDFLKGRDGFRYIQHRSAWEKIPAYRSASEIPPEHGQDIYLTLDMRLQNIVENTLDAIVQEYQPEKATILFMNPRNGEILAMGNRPTFDPNLRENPENFTNIAITTPYDPGSTFKIVPVSASFDLGLTRPKSTIFCHHRVYQEDCPNGIDTIKVTDHSPFGDLSIEEILIHSSNIGIYKIAKQLGKQKFYRYIKKFGFGERTGIALAGERKGTVRSTRRWNCADMSRIGMGYSISVTPIQLITAYAAIANGGKLLRPKIISETRTPEGERKHTDTKIRRRVISTDTARKMRHALMKVVNSPKGTGRNAALPGYLIAGKTGTAQKLIHGVYRDDRHMVSFAGFFPAENPKLVGLILIDDPKDDPEHRSGGEDAAPYFREIAEKSLHLFDIKPLSHSL